MFEGSHVDVITSARHYDLEADTTIRDTFFHHVCSHLAQGKCFPS